MYSFENTTTNTSIVIKAKYFYSVSLLLHFPGLNLKYHLNFWMKEKNVVWKFKTNSIFFIVVLSCKQWKPLKNIEIFYIIINNYLYTKMYIYYLLIFLISS